MHASGQKGSLCFLSKVDPFWNSTKPKPTNLAQENIGYQNTRLPQNTRLTRQNNLQQLIFEKTRNSVNCYAQVNHDATSDPAVTSHIC